MPIVRTGEHCHTHGCKRGVWLDGLCSPCWRLGRFGGCEWRSTLEDIRGLPEVVR